MLWNFVPHCCLVQSAAVGASCVGMSSMTLSTSGMDVPVCELKATLQALALNDLIVSFCFPVVNIAWQVDDVNVALLLHETSCLTVYCYENHCQTLLLCSSMHLKYYFKPTLWTWSLPVTRQRWRLHHSICHRWKPYATCKHHGTIFYRTRVTAIQRFSYSCNAILCFFCEKYWKI